MTPEQVAEWKRKRSPDRPRNKWGRSIPAVAAESRVVPPRAWAEAGLIHVTIPIYCKTNQSRINPQLSDKVIAGIFRRQHREYVQQRRTTWLTLCTLLPALSSERGQLGRDSISFLRLVRLSKGRAFRADNLPHSMKGVLDAVCAWLADGVHVLSYTDEQLSKIGDFDDWMIYDEEDNPDGRITLTYGQVTWEENKWLMGVEVMLGEPVLKSAE